MSVPHCTVYKQYQNSHLPPTKVPSLLHFIKEELRPKLPSTYNITVNVERGMLANPIILSRPVSINTNGTFNYKAIHGITTQTLNLAIGSSSTTQTAWQEHPGT
jgi:hypothetical protein